MERDKKKELKRREDSFIKPTIYIFIPNPILK